MSIFMKVRIVIFSHRNDYNIDNDVLVDESRRLHNRRGSNKSNELLKFIKNIELKQAVALFYS